MSALRRLVGGPYLEDVRSHDAARAGSAWETKSSSRDPTLFAAE